MPIMVASLLAGLVGYGIGVIFGRITGRQSERLKARRWLTTFKRNMRELTEPK